MFRCPCCDKEVFNDQHFFEICPNCQWEDDPVQYDDQNYAGGANIQSLNEYRRNYLERNSIKNFIESKK